MQGASGAGGETQMLLVELEDKHKEWNLSFSEFLGGSSRSSEDGDEAGRRSQEHSSDLARAESKLGTTPSCSQTQSCVSTWP